MAGVVGCNNVRTVHDSAHIAMIKELIKNDVLVLTTGCAAMACGKAGLLTPEAARQYAGQGSRRSVRRSVSHRCSIWVPASTTRGFLIAATAMVKEGGLGDDISDLPAAGAAPEWMSEKALAIGQYFVASGVFTVFGTTWPTLGSEKVTKHLFEEHEEMYKVCGPLSLDPIKAAS